DLADDDGDPMPNLNNSDFNHGTHVAGIIGAVGNNNLGVTGVAQRVQIMAAKGFNNSSTDGSAEERALIETVYYAVNNGARVSNCSWGRQGTPLQSELDAFNYAHDHGVVVVDAAGNSTMSAAGFSPAGISTVITVGAVDRSDQMAGYSNWGK